MYSYAPMSDTDEIDQSITQVANDIDMEEAEQQKKRDLLSSDIQRIVRRHLGEAEQGDVARQMASSSSSSRPVLLEI